MTEYLVVFVVALLFSGAGYFFCLRDVWGRRGISGGDYGRAGGTPPELGKVLILTAAVGGGHEAAGRTIGAELEEAGWSVAMADGLRVLSPILAWFLNWGYCKQARNKPGSLLPYALKALRRPVGAALGGTAAGLAYALSGILSKGVADAVRPLDMLPLALLAVGTLIFGLLSVAVELEALQTGYASVVVPVVLTIHTVIPIACAPLLFGEAWPDGLLPHALLGGGIFFALLGTIALSSSSARVPTKQ